MKIWKPNLPSSSSTKKIERIHSKAPLIEALLFSDLDLYTPSAYVYYDLVHNELITCMYITKSNCMKCAQPQPLLFC